MANNIIKRTWNQNKMVNIEDLCGMAFQAEADAHTFVISGTDDTGAVVPLTGTVAGVFRRADNADIALTGSASEGVVSVTLTDDCYAVPGRFGLTIFVTSGSQTTAVFAAVGTVALTTGGAVAGDTPQDVVDLINSIQAAIATIPASYNDLMAAIAPTYSSSALYAVGSYAWYNGKLYRCTTAITTAESWTADHWTIASGLNEIRDGLSRQAAEEAALRAAEGSPVYHHVFSVKKGHYGGTLNWLTSGSSTIDTPVKYDDSMAIIIKDTTVAFSIIFGFMVGGTFFPKQYTSVNANNPQTINIYTRNYVVNETVLTDPANTEKNCFLVFGFTTAPDKTIIPFDVITRSSVCKLQKMRALTLINDPKYLNRYKTESGVPRYDDSVTPPTVNNVSIFYYSTVVADSGASPGNHMRNTAPGGGALRSGTKYIYANGLPLDAAFYKKTQTGRDPNGDPVYTYIGIPWTENGGYTVGSMEESNTAASNSENVYPRIIEIPKDATHFDLNVYPATRIGYIVSLDPIFSKFQPEICFYGEYGHGVIQRKAAGEAIKNALNLINLKYKANRLAMRYITMNAYSSYGDHKTDKLFIGFPYGTGATPGMGASFYSYFSSFRFASGINGVVSSGRNAYYGFVCTALISSACGFPVVQGTEYWLQKYGDKAELATADTVWNVGDILVMQRYYPAARRTLYTHTGIVVDKLQNPETGDFAGYLFAESTNIWTRLNVTDRPGSTYEQTGSAPFVQRTWRIPFPLPSSPLPINQRYRYNVDIEKQTLDNLDKIEFPPAVLSLGDMVLAQDYDTSKRPGFSGNFAYVKNNGSNYGRCYTDKNYSHAALFVKTGNAFDLITKIDIENAPGFDGSAASSNSFLIDSFLPRQDEELVPGYYQLKLTNDPEASSYDDDSFTAPLSFRIFDWPDATLSADGKVLSDLSMGSFSDVWLRVVPIPRFGLPYANYMYIHLSEMIYDSEAGTYTLPENYQFVSRITWYDNEYGTVVKRFKSDYDGQPEEDYDDYNPDE